LRRSSARRMRDLLRFSANCRMFSARRRSHPASSRSSGFAARVSSFSARIRISSAERRFVRMTLAISASTSPPNFVLDGLGFRTQVRLASLLRLPRFAPGRHGTTRFALHSPAPPLSCPLTPLPLSGARAAAGWNRRAGPSNSAAPAHQRRGRSVSDRHRAEAGSPLPRPHGQRERPVRRAVDRWENVQGQVERAVAGEVLEGARAADHLVVEVLRQRLMVSFATRSAASPLCPPAARPARSAL
jgi:hypothetical protein